VICLLILELVVNLDVYQMHGYRRRIGVDESKEDRRFQL
jgi:hypothetical protein